jgi:gliding motility-associated-like protein
VKIVIHILAFAFLLVALASNAQIVSIPDAVFKSQLVAQHDTNGDFEIDVQEALQVTQLGAGWANIASTTGLEAFENLERLTITNCANLTSIDLSGNPQLTYLNLEFCNLSSIDLSPVTQLESLFLSHNNLSSLDLSPDTNLVFLEAAFNNLSAIDLSPTPLLKSLILQGNNLTEIELSVINCSLIELGLSGNNLTSLDISYHEELHELFLADMPTLENVCVWPVFITDDMMVNSGIINNFTWTDSNSTNISYAVCEIYDPCRCSIQSNETFEVPNVFTPNGDAHNERFGAALQNLGLYDLRIYNRWGEQVFHTDIVGGTWDGTIKGDNASEGQYYWVLVFGYDCAIEQTISKSGFVNLLR